MGYDPGQYLIFVFIIYSFVLGLEFSLDKRGLLGFIVTCSNLSFKLLEETFSILTAFLRVLLIG